MYKKKRNVQVVTCIAALFLFVFPAHGAEQGKAVTPMLSLLLAGEDGCYSSSPVNITSITSERSAPFSRVTLTVENVKSLIPGQSFITYNKTLKVPLSSIDYSTGAIVSMLPNTPGTVQVSLETPCAVVTNSKAITIGPLSLPPGKTTTGVLTEFDSEISTYHSAMQAEASNPAHTASQREGYAQLALEYDAYGQLFQYLLNEVATGAEKDEIAALLVDYLATAAPFSAGAAEMRIGVRSVGTEWNTINTRRTQLKAGGLLNAVTSWGRLGILTNNPVVKVIDASLTILKLLQSSHGLKPSLLKDFTVVVDYPVDGFYTDSADATLNCKGTFEPYASLFLNVGINTVVGKLLGAVKMPGLDGKLNDFVGQGIKSTLLSDLLKNETMAQLSGPIQALSNAFAKAYATQNSAYNVEFPCNGGVKLSQAKVHRPPHKVELILETVSSAKPVAIGKDSITLLFMDSLNNDAHKVVEQQFSIEVENHFPEVTNNPQCDLDENGECDFWVELEDKDVDDQTQASLDSSNNLTEGTATRVATQADRFRFQYISNDKTREEYTDVIRIRYEDKYEYDILEVPVRGAQPGTCTSGPQTVNYAGNEWQRCDDGNRYIWENAKTYCSNLSLDGGGWRLPTKDELKSLVVCSNGTATPLQDYPGTPYYCGVGNSASYDAPTIDMQFSCHSRYYWSSSVSDEGYAWYVNFNNGGANWYARPRNSYVRCVR